MKIEDYEMEHIKVVDITKLRATIARLEAELKAKNAVIQAAQKVLDQFEKGSRMFDALMELKAALRKAQDAK